MYSKLNYGVFTILETRSIIVVLISFLSWNSLFILNNKRLQMYIINFDGCGLHCPIAFIYIVFLFAISYPRDKLNY